MIFYVWMTKWAVERYLDLVNKRTGLSESLDENIDKVIIIWRAGRIVLDHDSDPTVLDLWPTAFAWSCARCTVDLHTVVFAHRRCCDMTVSGRTQNTSRLVDKCETLFVRITVAYPVRYIHPEHKIRKSTYCFTRVCKNESYIIFSYIKCCWSCRYTTTKYAITSINV